MSQLWAENVKFCCVLNDIRTRPITRKADLCLSQYAINAAVCHTGFVIYTFILLFTDMYTQISSNSCTDIIIIIGQCVSVLIMLLNCFVIYFFFLYLYTNVL